MLAPTACPPEAIRSIGEGSRPDSKKLIPLESVEPRLLLNQLTLFLNTKLFLFTINQK